MYKQPFIIFFCIWINSSFYAPGRFMAEERGSSTWIICLFTCNSVLPLNFLSAIFEFRQCPCHNCEFTLGVSHTSQTSSGGSFNMKGFEILLCCQGPLCFTEHFIFMSWTEREGEWYISHLTLWVTPIMSDPVMTQVFATSITFTRGFCHSNCSFQVSTHNKHHIHAPSALFPHQCSRRADPTIFEGGGGEGPNQLCSSLDKNRDTSFQNADIWPNPNGKVCRNP